MSLEGLSFAYIERDLLRRYGFEQFPPLNFPIQPCAAEMDSKYFRSFRKERMTPSYQYHVCSENGEAWAHAATESEAIRVAEERAKAHPGKKYYVTKAITCSYVAPTPSITTRL